MRYIIEAARDVVAEVDGLLRECGRVRECDLADASLMLEARVTVPGSPEEAEDVSGDAVLLLAPTIDGRDLVAILRWLEERATVKYVAGSGAEVALGLEAPSIERALDVLGQVALKLSSLIGPGVLVKLMGVLDEDSRPLWSLSIQVCEEASGGLGEAAEHGAEALLRIAGALQLDPKRLEQGDIKPIGSASTTPEEPREICAGLKIHIPPRGEWHI